MGPVGTVVRGWMVDVVLGGVVGGVVGAIVAVNLVIYAGPEQGYESGIGDVFDHNTIVGVATVAILIGGPVLGVVLTRRLRRGRLRADQPSDHRSDPPDPPDPPDRPSTRPPH